MAQRIDNSRTNSFIKNYCHYHMQKKQKLMEKLLKQLIAMTISQANENFSEQEQKKIENWVLERTE